MLTVTSSGPDFDELLTKCTAPPTVLARLTRQFYELSDATVLRHLVACDGDFERTVAHLEEMMLWRQKTFTWTERPDHQTAGRGCVFYTHGTDNKGHPLLIFTTRLLHIKTRDVNEAVRWFLYMVEVAVQSLPPHLEQVTILVNCVGNEQRRDFEFSQKFYPLLNSYYPNRVHKVLWYPVSQTLRTIQGIVHFIGGSSSGNKVFCSSLEMLRAEVPDEYIPSEMGGSCTYEVSVYDFPPPTPSERYEYAVEQGMCSAPASLNVSGDVKQNSATTSDETAIEPVTRANSIVGTYSYMVSAFARVCVNACCSNIALSLFCCRHQR
jgi:hypothetical protein